MDYIHFLMVKVILVSNIYNDIESSAYLIGGGGSSFYICFLSATNNGLKIQEGAADLMCKVSEGIISLDCALSSDILSELQVIKNWRGSMESYRFARLWLMYIDMIKMLRAFITASRNGNWRLYLQALHEMLPFLAASGHSNYVKSLVLYLDKMEHLEQTHPTVYNRFMGGLFVLRRSDSHWSGIYSDLYIEQVLMGGIKSVGGLTRGRGFD